MADTAPIATLDDLKRAIDDVWVDISSSCAVCTDPDCMGYIWVLGEEEDPLLDADVTLVQVNGSDGPVFLDSYHRDADGKMIVSLAGPKCPWLGEDGRCSVHEARPLVCHMYPLSLERDRHGAIVWGLHTDCQYVRSQSEAELAQLLDRLRALIASVETELLDEVVGTFQKVEALSPSDFVSPECYITVATAIPPPPGGRRVASDAV